MADEVYRIGKKFAAAHPKCGWVDEILYASRHAAELAVMLHKQGCKK